MLDYLAFIAFRLGWLVIGLLILSVPALIVFGLRRILPRSLRPVATFLLAVFALPVVAVGLWGLSAIFGVGDGDECLERHYQEERVAVSPTRSRTARVSSGVCVTGFLAPDSYDGVDIEISRAGSGDSKLVFKGYSLAEGAIDVEWSGDGVLRIRLRKAIPVGKSLHEVDGVRVEYHVSPDVLNALPADPKRAEKFRSWVADNARLD